MAQKVGHAASSADGAMDAINAALGLEGAEAHEEAVEEEIVEAPEGDEGEGSAEGGYADEGDGESDADEGGEEGEEGEEDVAAVAAAAGGERNPDGTFKKAGEVKKLDPINDPIPKDLKKETSERMQSLINTAKTLTAERDQVRTDFDTIINGIKAAGASPEQYGEVISWMSMFNKGPGDPGFKTAYELVESVADRMATLLNLDRSAPNPLMQHPDLQAAVTAGQITAKYAGEIARTRNATTFKTELSNGQRQQQQTQDQAAQEEATARAGLTAFETEMRTKEPELYELKKAQIIGPLRAVMKQLPKVQWLPTYQAAYANARVKPQGRPAVRNTQQPLRANKNPAGGQGSAATSMMDAVNGALASMK